MSTKTQYRSRTGSAKSPTGTCDVCDCAVLVTSEMMNARPDVVSRKAAVRPQPTETSKQ